MSFSKWTVIIVALNPSVKLGRVYEGRFGGSLTPSLGNFRKINQYVLIDRLNIADKYDSVPWPAFTTAKYVSEIWTRRRQIMCAEAVEVRRTQDFRTVNENYLWSTWAKSVNRWRCRNTFGNLV